MYVTFFDVVALRTKIGESGGAAPKLASIETCDDDDSATCLRVVVVVGNALIVVVVVVDVVC